MAVSRSKIRLRAWASRIMLCSQKNEATRTPLVTGVTMVVGELALWEKTGGRSGHWRRPPGQLTAPLVNTPPLKTGLDDEIDALIAEGGDSDGGVGAGGEGFSSAP